MGSSISSFLAFVDTAKCFDAKSKINLAVFLSGMKKCCFVRLKVYPKNLDDRLFFERFLKREGILFNRSVAKSFEEIGSIRDNVVRWDSAGIWFGYDLFASEKVKDDFERYVLLLRKQRNREADFLAGKLYDYPQCCVRQFVREQEPSFLKGYSCYQFYKRLHDADRRFPWVFHVACPKCKRTGIMDKKYRACAKKFLPKTFYYYSDPFSLKCDFVVDAESDVLDNGRSIWPVKDGHEYAVVALKPVDGHYYLVAMLSKKELRRGALFEGVAKLKYDYADIKVKRVKGVVNLRHFRRIK